MIDVDSQQVGREGGLILHPRHPTVGYIRGPGKIHFKMEVDWHPSPLLAGRFCHIPDFSRQLCLARQTLNVGRTCLIISFLTSKCFPSSLVVACSVIYSTHEYELSHKIPSACLRNHLNHSPSSFFFLTIPKTLQHKRPENMPGYTHMYTFISIH